MKLYIQTSQLHWKIALVFGKYMYSANYELILLFWKQSTVNEYVVPFPLTIAGSL